MKERRFLLLTVLYCTVCVCVHCEGYVREVHRRLVAVRTYIAQTARLDSSISK